MLVYANSLHVPAATGNIECVLSAVDSWLLFKTRKRLNASSNINKPAIRLADGKELEVILSGASSKSQGVRASVVFSHPDEKVNGRKWFTRIGFSQQTTSATALVTVVTETSDISTQAGASRVFATRPGVIRNLVSKCGVTAPSPAAQILQLTPENADALATEIQDRQRAHAIVLISPEPFSEHLFVNPMDLLDKVVGLARVVVIPNKAHTREISDRLGRRFSAWGGAVNVIMPPFPSGYISNELLAVDRLKYEAGRDKSPENYLLYLLTHRLNLPHYQREVTPSSVRQYSLDLRFTQLKTNETNVRQLEEMLRIVQDQNAQKDEELRRLRDENTKAWCEWEEAERRAEDVTKLRTEIDSYRAAFKKLKSEGRLSPQDDQPICSVADAITLAEERFATEIVFALNAKSDGPESPFQPATEVFEALRWLAGVYYLARTGKTRCHNFDHSIRSTIQGWSYAAHQSEITKRRFSEWYRCRWEDRPYDIAEHIGCGTSTRPEETIRIAFTWDKDREKVVIGFIGQHQRTSKS